MLLCINCYIRGSLFDNYDQQLLIMEQRYPSKFFKIMIFIILNKKVNFEKSIRL